MGAHQFNITPIELWAAIRKSMNGAGSVGEFKKDDVDVVIKGALNFRALADHINKIYEPPKIDKGRTTPDNWPTGYKGRRGDL